MLIQDSVVGQATLRVQGVNGQSTDWVEIKDQDDCAVGKCLISICRESLGEEGDYTHLVQGTEECAMIDGD